MLIRRNIGFHFKIRVLALPFFLFASLLIYSTAFSQGQSEALRTIHVKFKEQFLPRKAHSARSITSGIAQMDAVSIKHNAVSMSRIFPEAGIYEEAHRAHGLHLWYEIKFSMDVKLDKAIADYKDLNYFHHVEECKDYAATWESDGPEPVLPSGTNDPLFSNQWNFNNSGQTGGKPGADINLLKAWKTETGSPNVIVAVIDGGIDLTHPDLAGAFWTNDDEIPDNGVDDDHNGYVDDVHGFGFGDGSPQIFPNFHATHVAGTIGAVSNNGIGVSGIAGGSGSGDGVRLMSCAGFGNFGIGGFEAAMVYAADNGAVISQNSWGGGSTAIEAAIDYFVQRAGYDNSSAKYTLNIQTGPMAGGLVIFAAGNSNTSDPNVGYPASYHNAIAVASTDHNDVKSSFSNYGNWVDIAAPGSTILSTYPGSDYKTLSGTSMACPQVSGVAALVTSYLQGAGLNPTQVWDRIRITAHSISIENPSMDGLLGSGRLDAFGSLQLPDAIPPAAVLDLHAVEVHFSSIALGWTATGESGNTGQAAEYEIRYSTSPISSLNFNNATLLSNPPVPPLAGDQVNLELKDLSPTTTYYVALKTRDIFNNISGLSNIITVTTKSAPIPVVITTGLSEQLYTGGISTKDILVKNSGGDELLIRLGVPDISPAPVGWPTGAKGRLFAIKTSNNTIEELNPKTGAVIHSISLPEPSTKDAEGLAFDGENVFYGSSSKKIYKLNAQTGQVLRSFGLDSTFTIDELAWSGHYLYASDRNAGKTYEVDSDNGTILRWFDYAGGGLTFAGNRGTIFVTASGGLEEVIVATGQAIREIQVEGNIKHLGYSEVEGVIFVSDGLTSIRAVQPDTGAILYTLSYLPTTALASDEYKPGWLTTGEQVVTIASGATSSVPVKFVATGLSARQLTGTVRVIPTNVNSGPVAVPVALSVMTETDIEALEEIDFGAQFLGFAIDSIISIENRGFSDLIIADIHSNDSRVTASLSTVTLAPGQKVPMTVTITPAGAGTIDASVIFTSNDPDEGVLSMSVRAEVFLSPAVEVSPASLSTTLSVGESTTLNFTGNNTGGSVLHWKVNFSGTGAPGFSQSTVKQGASSGPSDSTSISGVGEFTLKAPSPEQLTCLSYDPQSGFIYAKSFTGNTFYRYDPVANRWTTIGSTPGTFIGQAVYLDGKIYHGGTQLSIYAIQTNSWTTIAFPVQAGTGNLASDGQYLYVTFGATFYRYDPASNTWLPLADVPRDIHSYGALSCHSGVVYAHEDAAAGFTGNGNTNFFKYYIASNTWLTNNDGIPGKASAGSAIDPTGGKYFVVGAPWARPGVGIQMSILDLNEGEWQKKVLPFTVGTMSGLVFVGKPGYSGIYFVQGNEGTGFGRYETVPPADWITITPSQGDLAPGATQTFAVGLNATGLASGMYSGNLSVSSAHPALEGTLPLALNVVGAPDISMNLTTADLGDVIIGKGKGVYLIIKNTGTETLSVPSITIDHPDFTISSTSFTLPTGELVAIVPSFQPTTSGPQIGTFTIHNNDPDEGSVQFVLKGNGVYPPIPGITPGSMSATLLTGATFEQNFIISNTGGSVMDYAIDFLPAGDWLKGYPYGDLSPGQTDTISVTMDAGEKATGTYSGKIQLWWHGDLQTEIPATMTVIGAADILTSKKSVAFGDEYVGNSYDSIIQIKNNGVLPLSITAIDSDNPVFSTSARAPLNIAPGEGINATIRFSPTIVSAQSGRITIISDDPDEGTYVISLSGNGVGPPILTSTPTQLTASVFTNESQTQNLTIVNSGGSVLKWRIIGESNPYPLSINGPVEPLASGDFTSFGPTQEKLMSPTIDPISGLIYAQSPYNQHVDVYNPITHGWSEEPGTSLSNNSTSGGAVILKSKMYAVYPENNSKIGVYDLILRDWTSIPNNLGAGTRTITTDGTLLYLAGGGNFKSLNPATGAWTGLPLPTITLDGAGGLSYFNGAIYAHEGNGNGFAKFTVSTGNWETLVPLPDKTVLGSTVDPVRKRYYAYGKNGGNYLYEYDLTANLWNTLAFTLFDVSDGGMVYVPDTGFDGIYFIQGMQGTGFARYEPKSELTWLRIAPLTGEIPASGNQTIGINYNAYRLNTGTYAGAIHVLSNDPNFPTMDIPVTLNVTNPGPVIEVPVLISATIERSSQYTIQWKVENKGPGPLQWSFANTLPAWLTASKISDTVSGFSFENIELKVDASLIATGVVNYFLEINSNDLLNSKVSTKLHFILITDYPPVVTIPINTQSLKYNAVRISLANRFADPDNDPLVYSATSSDSLVASVDLSGSVLTVNPVSPGTATIEVHATDIFNLSATMTFSVNVSQTVTSIQGTGIEGVPTETGLQASPNPFGTDVTIHYQTENPGHAIVFVSDIVGRIVWQVDGYQEVPGRNEIEIDGRQLAPGMYNCSLLRNGNRIGTVRLVRN